MRLNKIVVAVDFSDESEFAIQQALEIARHTGAHLTLLHVGAVPDHPIGVPATMHTTVAEYLRLVEEDLARDRKRLEQIRERISGQGVEVSQVVIDGIPDQGIRSAADEMGADMIVMGTHGRTGLKRFFLGSVAERVVRLSKKHVMVARPAEQFKGGFHRILVTTDFAEVADPVLDMAAAVASSGAEIDVLHCWHLPPMSYPYYAPTKSARDVVNSLRDVIADGTTKMGNELVERHRSKDVKIEFHQLEQAPAQGIQRWIEDHEGYDLVVTGSHGRRGAARLLLGSVAEFTVRHSPTSVLVVHAGTQLRAVDSSEQGK
ncbi:MAG: universal stress protein [Proteobacteria bacterium]|nr:universal stress protein [Pseudomonadota bacterium]